MFCKNAIHYMCIFSIVMFLFFPSLAESETLVEHNIILDTTWTIENSPYIISGIIKVYPHVRLTIEPGVEVLFSENPSSFLKVSGELIAIGESLNPIVFMPRDDLVIGGLEFDDNSVDAVYDDNSNYVSGSIIYNCTFDRLVKAITVSYANPYIAENKFQNCSSYIYPSKTHFQVLSFEHCSNIMVRKNQFMNFSTQGGICCGPQYDKYIYVYRSNVVFEQNSFDTLQSHPVIFNHYSSLKLINNSFTNVNYALFLYEGDIANDIYLFHNNFVDCNYAVYMYPWANTPWPNDIIATYNWWGTTDLMSIHQMLNDYFDDMDLKKIIIEPYAQSLYPISTTIDDSPSASAGQDQIIFNAITLDASDSFDNDNDTLTYSWQIIHRTNSTYNRVVMGVRPTITELQSGFYDVILTVTDSGGLLDTDTMFFAAIGQAYSMEEYDQMIAEKDAVIATMFTQEEFNKAIHNEMIKYDPNGDGKIGMDNVLYYMKVLSGKKGTE